MDNQANIVIEVHPVSDPNVVMSLGEYAEMLLTEMNYYNTLFPRIPLNIDREIKKNILMMKDRRARKRKNQEFYDEFVRGAKIMAISPEVSQLNLFYTQLYRTMIGMRLLLLGSKVGSCGLNLQISKKSMTMQILL